MTVTTKFYSLLFVDQENINPNLRPSVDSLDVYVSCAGLCAKTFAAIKAPYSVITNNASLLRERFDRLKLEPPNLESHDFTLQVPKRIPFYSAHFKLELLQQFGQGWFGTHVGLVDLDIVALRPIPQDDRLGVYDISDQIFVDGGGENIRSELERIAGRRLADVNWYGGEFVVGSAAAFSGLARYIDACLPRYVANLASLSHVGDEMVLSAAINSARADGMDVADYSAESQVARWWTARTRHKQVPFDTLSAVCFLHLPADKEFLAGQARFPFCRDTFVGYFRSYARRKIAIRRAYGLCEKILGRSPMHTPSLNS
jgi:hypothetical protein